MSKMHGCLAGLRVLLVDDTPDCKLMTTLLLTRAGASVESTDNGEDGVKLALAGTFDLVMMDLQMPNMSGITAIMALRAGGYSGNILAYSAHAFTHHIVEATKAGATGYLVKPFGYVELVMEVSNVMGIGKMKKKTPLGEQVSVKETL